jgi:hypothetical protein
MKTNDLKKGDTVFLKNGWKAEIMDNKKGNIRFAKVYGNYTELGSVYAWDIKEALKGSETVKIELTESQIKARINATFFYK